MAATARKRTAAVVSTISKKDAMKAILAGDLKPNKYKRPCILCGEIVEAETGLLGGNKTEGWWAAHKDGKCVGVTEEDTAAEPATAAKVDKPNVKVRGTNNQRSTPMAAAKKTAVRTRKVATPTATAATPTTRKRAAAKPTLPAKKTTTPRKTAAKPAPEVESASPENEVPQNVLDMVKGISDLIKSGTLDAVLVMLDDAITDRLDAVAPAPAKTAAKKTTTSTATRAEKLAPVKRGRPTVRKTDADDEMNEAQKVVASKSASAKTASVKPRPRAGREYTIQHGRLKSNGQNVIFKSLDKESGGKKANVALVNEFGGKPVGFRFQVPTSSLVAVES